MKKKLIIIVASLITIAVFYVAFFYVGNNYIFCTQSGKEIGRMPNASATNSIFSWLDMSESKCCRGLSVHEIMRNGSPLMDVGICK